jgi:thiosulfate dehydrogenase
MKSNVILTLAATGIVAATMLSLSLTTANADELSEQAAIARGGQLYDKWFKVVGVDKPSETHAAYPSAGKKKGNATWRCKECHGWDYLGAAGAYAKGSHFSGIKGVNGMAGADPGAIVGVLKDKNHGLGDVGMEAGDLMDVALFVSKGQVDMDQYIDRATKAPKGDKAKGKVYFETICIGCHSADGTKPKDMEKTLGAQMGNPWEVMHKILNGQPDEKMPALRALDRQVVVDIMAHITTLPKEK